MRNMRRKPGIKDRPLCKTTLSHRNDFRATPCVKSQQHRRSCKKKNPRACDNTHPMNTSNTRFCTNTLTLQYNSSISLVTPVFRILRPTTYPYHSYAHRNEAETFGFPLFAGINIKKTFDY